jgi:hypothetical protein
MRGNSRLLSELKDGAMPWEGKNIKIIKRAYCGQQCFGSAWT